ncbi:MAG: hypothetical protein IKR99_07030 [Lachnospiraceae bacterium]|nr:hypothetical protein [Lachnospiraceae bacterium]
MNNEMRKANIFVPSEYAGILCETDEGITAKRLMEKITSFQESFLQACRDSLLPSDMKDSMMQLVNMRMDRLR